MKKTLFTLFYIFSSGLLMAQQWTTSGTNVHTSADKVGIGTSSPVFKLDINSPDNGGATRIRIANTSSSGTNAPGSMPAVEILGARGDGNNTFEGRLALGTRRTDGTGISTQTLGAVLFGGQHGTDATFQASKILYPASIQGIAEGNFSSATAMPTGIVFMTGTTGHDIGTPNLSYGTERMRITSSGNVSIGTTNPGSYKLAVEGKIGAREVKVTLENPWADYVFSEHYNLIDLKALEAYIKKNNHLPGIPSANEVKENGGIDLGEMNRKLLEKVEELTLYIIDLKKENNQIKETVEELKERLK